jgi:hypothetical protein
MKQVLRILRTIGTPITEIFMTIRPIMAAESDQLIAVHGKVALMWPDRAEQGEL